MLDSAVHNFTLRIFTNEFFYLEDSLILFSSRKVTYVKNIFLNFSMISCGY